MYKLGNELEGEFAKIANKIMPIVYIAIKLNYLLKSLIQRI